MKNKDLIFLEQLFSALHLNVEYLWLETASLDLNLGQDCMFFSASLEFRFVEINLHKYCIFPVIFMSKFFLLLLEYVDSNSSIMPCAFSISVICMIF